VKKHIPILAYHSFDTVRFPKNKLAISPDLFRVHMERLRRGGYEVVPLAKCAELRGKESIFQSLTALTFDDGYLDNYEHAFPVLARLGFPGTFFVTPEAVGTKGFMTWGMLKEMLRTPGIEIGSHGLFHKPLADISENEARTSIFDSKKLLEDKLATPVRAFSYPSGSFTGKIVGMVREAGYQYACAASHVHDRRYLGNPHLLRRIKISVTSESPHGFFWRLSGFYHAFGRP